MRDEEVDDIVELSWLAGNSSRLEFKHQAQNNNILSPHLLEGKQTYGMSFGVQGDTQADDNNRYRDDRHNIWTRIWRDRKEKLNHKLQFRRNLLKNAKL